MVDPRLENLAATLVSYSAAIKPGDTVEHLLDGQTPALRQALL